MRRITLILLLSALIAPAAAFAGDRAAGDGSLAVSAANGTIVVTGKGLIFGHFDQGTMTVFDYRADDPTAVISVTGAKVKVTQGLRVYSGTDVRFLLPSGSYQIRLVATGVDLSAVGKGSVGVTPLGTVDDGTFAVNGGKSQPLAKGAVPGVVFGGK